MIAESVVALTSLLGPSIIDFVKKKFIKQDKTDPEAVMGNLAVQSPETLSPYVTAMASLLDAQTRFFNRDVVGTPSLWIVDLRAAIRPLSVIGGFVLLGLEGLGVMTLDPAIRISIVANNGSWFGHKLTL